MCVILLTVPSRCLTVPSRCFAVLRRRFPSPWPQHIPVVQSQRAASQTVPPTLRARAAPATARRTSPWKHRLPRYRIVSPPLLRAQCKMAGCWLWGQASELRADPATEPSDQPTFSSAFPLYTSTLRKRLAVETGWPNGVSPRLQVLLSKRVSFHCFLLKRETCFS